jgi:hypothetical protein
MMRKALISATWLALTCMMAAPVSAQQSPLMNFFVALKGPSRGANRPAVEVSDENCHDLAYVQGYGDLTWHAYLDGKASDGEGAVKARDRIGKGPWYNYYGVVIAENLEQLHSDDNNLWGQTALTVTGEMLPEGALEIPWGSQLDGKDFTRDGPYFCFGIR